MLLRGGISNLSRWAILSLYSNGGLCFLFYDTHHSYNDLLRSPTVSSMKALALFLFFPLLLSMPATMHIFRINLLRNE